MLKRQKSLARISPLACMGLFHSCLKSLERGREECLFWGGGILWLTSNFLSSRTKVAGKLHPSVLQSFHDKQIKQNVSEPESDTPELFLWADPCADLSGRVLTGGRRLDHHHSSLERCLHTSISLTGKKRHFGSIIFIEEPVDPKSNTGVYEYIR